MRRRAQRLAADLLHRDQRLPLAVLLVLEEPAAARIDGRTEAPVELAHPGVTTRLAWPFQRRPPNAEEGEASETIQAEYTGEETDIGFNAQYLQDFLNVIGEGAVAFEFKDGNSQAQLRPAEGGDYDYKYVVMPMRL